MKYQLDKDYNSLDRIGEWDPKTQAVIKKRIADEVGKEMSFSFLTEKQGRLLAKITDILIPQSDNSQYVKIAEAIDKNLLKAPRGVRYGDNLWKAEIYQKGLTEFEKQLDKKFTPENIEKIIKQSFEPNQKNLITEFLSQALVDSIEIYYSHPVSWNQIGFPGPAYPEGYAYLACNEADSWEPKFLKD